MVGQKLGLYKSRVMLPFKAFGTMAMAREVRILSLTSHLNIYILFICNAKQEFENDQDRAKCFWCWKWVSWRQAIPTSWTVVTLSSVTLLKMKILWLLKLVMSLSPFKLSQVEKNMFLHKRKLKTEYTNKKETNLNSLTEAIPLTTTRQGFFFCSLEFKSFN